MAEVIEVARSAVDPEHFASVLTNEQAVALRAAVDHARHLFVGRTIWNGNSTAKGGGVAEMLTSLLPYVRGAGVDTRWLVIGGDPGFFAITKRIHNRLHGAPGDGGDLGDIERAHYEGELAGQAEQIRQRVRHGDVVVLHDPQTAGLVPPLTEAGVGVIWRCHVGLDTPNQRARSTWGFLLPTCVWPSSGPPAFWPTKVGRSAPTLVSTAARDGSSIAPPPWNPRRWTATPRWCSRSRGGTVSRTRSACSTDSRTVWWPGVTPTSCSPGPSAADVADDPEGADTLAEVTQRWGSLGEQVRARIHLVCLPMDDAQENAAMVNALQRHAQVVVQKSLAEGFGLTVAEAMWKARPVVASRIGGIQDQIEDGVTGVLLSDPTDLGAYADAVTGLLIDPDRASAIGVAAQAHVRSDFLGSRHLAQYVEICAELL